MRKATTHDSYLAAIQACMATHDWQRHYFSTFDVLHGGEYVGNLDRDISDVDEDFIDAGMASTFIEWAAANPCVSAVGLTFGDAHGGYVLIHYTPSGEIVRFVAIH